MKKIFGYCRVSSSSQNISRQLEELKKHGIDERDIFCDKQSGKDFDREQYKHKGRRKRAIENFREVVEEWRAGKISALAACRKLGISSSTFYRRISEV